MGKQQKITVTVFTVPHPKPTAAVKLVAEIVTKQLIAKPELVEMRSLAQ